MLTNYTGKITIQHWLNNLKTEFGINPTQFVIDADPAEISGIQSIFKDTKIVLCYFHVLRAVTIKLKEVVILPDKEQQKAIHDLITQDLKRILFNSENTENDIQKFLEKYASFRRFKSYFQKQWMSKINMWLRTENNTFDILLLTNNLTENFFSVLKTVILKNQPNKRLDSLVYVLVEIVIPRFWRKEFKVITGDEKPNTRGPEVSQKKQLDILEDEEIKELVKLNIINNLELFVVQSPHRSEMSYNVELNYQNKTGQCSCEMFTIEECSCIHTLAVYRYINIHKNFYREKIRGSPQNAISLCLRIEMFPLDGQKIGAYVAEELLEELDEEGELETSVSEIMNQLAASNESLEGCLPISSLLSLAIAIIDEASESSNDEAPTILTSNHLDEIGSSYDPQFDDYVNDPDGFESRLQEAMAMSSSPIISDEENENQEISNSNFQNGENFFSREEGRSIELLPSLPPPSHNTSVSTSRDTLNTTSRNTQNTTANTTEYDPEIDEPIRESLDIYHLLLSIKRR